MNEMKTYYGLKDEDGKEVRVLIADDCELDKSRIVSVEPIEPKPNYEVPRWYHYKMQKIDSIFYATKFDGLYLYSAEEESYHKQFSRPATPTKIESRLRKICDEKYIGKKVKCLYRNTEVKFLVSYLDNYDYINDILWYSTDYHSNICVYKQGIFAEIIPDKKKLPKTKEEFEKAFNEFANSMDDINDFLNKYED